MVRIMSTISTVDDRLASTLFGRTRRRVLGLLFGRPDEEFYVREIIRVTGSAPGAVQRELRTLEAAGILARRRGGNQVYYRANPKCPVFADLQAIVMKTVGLVDVLCAALDPLREQIQVAFVFGSLARGQVTSESDVDLLVVGDVGFGDIVEHLVSTGSALGREVNPVVHSAEEFRKRVAVADHFLTSVLREPKLFVCGDVDELGRLGAGGVVDPAQHQRRGDR